MPPKKNKAAVKAVEKKKERVIEDRTFGLKNKNKSKKVQQFVKQVTANVKNAGKNPRDLAKEKAAKEAKKLEKEAKEMEMAEVGALFKAVADGGRQTVQAGVDPKSVLCMFFKAGHCARGAKCKFSHDLSVERKTAKIDVYTDPRDLRKQETMDEWDQAKLEEVVSKKHVPKPTETDIVCKFFLDAIERRLYGWFWECPNGEKCHYRHALPPGYVLKPKVNKEEAAADDEDGPTLEEKIEDERAKLDFSKCTGVTPESFSTWKAAQRAKKESEIKARAVESVKKQGGKVFGMSGRALFTYDPTLFVDDEDAHVAYEFDDENAHWAEIAEAKRLEEEQDAGSDETKSEEEEDDEKRAEDGIAEDGSASEDEDDEKNQVVQVHDASLFLDDEDLPEEEEEEEDEVE